MNTAALSEYVSYYDEGVITKELVMAKWSTSLDHVSECLIGCLNGDEKLVDKVFRLLIFRLYLQTLDEKLDVRIAYWSSILAVLKREQPLERERQLFLRARCNEILGESYHTAGDTEQALNRFQDAGCLFHIRYSYMMMDERCPDCDYKFNKEETLAMIAHCPFCLGDRLVTRARPYFGEPAEDSSQEAFSELMKAQGRCLEMEVQHISFGSLRDTFDTFASGNR